MKKGKQCKLAELYFDGQLQAVDVDSFKEHLNSCMYCREYLQMLSKVSEFVKLGMVVRLDDKTVENVWERVEGELLRGALLPEEEDILSFYDIVKKYIFRPFFVLAFLILVFIFPMLNRDNSVAVFSTEAKIKEISSDKNIYVFHTKNKNWTVIWLQS